MSSDSSTTSKLKSLRSLNLKLAILHFVQAMIVLLVSNNFSMNITTRFLTFDEGSKSLVESQASIGQIRFVWFVVIFFLMSAVAHFLVATKYNKWYERNLKIGINKARWYEYSFSASVMMIAIAMLVGIYDLSSLIMIFVLTALMNLMGLMMEVHNQTTKKTDWISFNIGCIAGIVPWLVILIYFLGAAISGGGASTIPAFVYWIYVSIFIFFNCFAINMILQYTKKGKWADYLYGERVYMFLSLIAKSLLAWQVYAGTLQPA